MLVVFITVETYYAQIGETVNISASINSTSRVSSIQWYWNETLLDPASDRRYSVDSDSSQSVLTILRFETKLVGRYGIVVFGASGRNSTDGVNVLLSGEPKTEEEEGGREGGRERGGEGEREGGREGGRERERGRERGREGEVEEKECGCLGFI